LCCAHTGARRCPWLLSNAWLSLLAELLQQLPWLRRQLLLLLLLLLVLHLLAIWQLQLSHGDSGGEPLQRR
jgi:hypothetical protein